MMKFIIPLVIIILTIFLLQDPAQVVTWQSDQPEVVTKEFDRVLNPETEHHTLSDESSGYLHPGAEEQAAPRLDQQAIESLRVARLHGDDRTPNLNKSRERDELPTPEQLEDPQLYQEYERRQQQRMYRAYVEAAKIKTAEIQTMIEQGKEGGISDEEIAFAEAKIKGIEDMAAQLQRDHPEIMEDEYKPADDWLIDNLGVSDPETSTQQEPDNN